MTSIESLIKNLNLTKASKKGDIEEKFFSVDSFSIDDNSIKLLMKQLEVDSRIYASRRVHEFLKGPKLGDRVSVRVKGEKVSIETIEKVVDYNKKTVLIEMKSSYAEYGFEPKGKQFKFSRETGKCLTKSKDGFIKSILPR